jgi:hypothetical protein
MWKWENVSDLRMRGLMVNSDVEYLCRMFQVRQLYLETGQQI